MSEAMDLDVKRRSEGGTLKLFLLAIAVLASSLSVVLAQVNLCDGNSAAPMVVKLSNVSKSYEYKSTQNGTSKEWIFESDEFITVLFSDFFLSGPECDDNLLSVSKVRIKTSLTGYTFCKGRRSPDIHMSSSKRLHVAYCNSYVGGKIKFEVTSGCTAQFIVQEKRKTVVVQNHGQQRHCWMSLQSLRGQIMANFTAVSTKKNNGVKCRRSYISVKTGDDRKSLLPDGKDKLCRLRNISNTLQPFVASETASLVFNITYKLATFTLTFWEQIESEETTSRPHTFSVEDDTANRVVNTSGVTGLINDAGGAGNDDAGSLHIVLIGCGGLLVLLAIIGTLVFLRRKSRKSNSSTNAKKRDAGSSTARIGDELLRNSSLVSINNAMYDQLVSGSGVSESDVQEAERRRESKYRLTELEEKYGPFPETSGFRQEQSQRLVRQDTRPLLPPPTKPSGHAAERQTQPIATTTANLYEDIDNMQARRKRLNDFEGRRPISCATFTSEEFSDVDDGEPNAQNASYDPVCRENNYATILDGPGVTYDAVEHEKRHSTVPSVKYVDNTCCRNGSGSRAPLAQCLNNGSDEQRHTPRIDIHPPSMFHRSKLLLNTPEPQYQTPNKVQRSLNANLPHAKSHDLIAPDTAQHYLTPRPSLPNISGNISNNSLVSPLQEDSENYLKPRPSCPDVMIRCAYSSSEDLSDIRRRLLAAAHPSLLEVSSDLSSDEAQAEVQYDSPRTAVMGNALNVQPEEHYASP